MDEDDDLTHLLDQAADPPVATPDSFRQVMTRYRRGRTRTLAAALVAVALLGPAVGVAVGRATAHHGVQVATAGQPPAAATGSSGSSGSAASSGSAPVARIDGSNVSSGGSVSAVAGFTGPDAKRLFARTTADGVRIRADLQSGPKAAPDGCATDKGPSPCPILPPDCGPDSILMAGLSDDGAVEPGFAPASATEGKGPLVVLQASWFGVREADPAAWVVVKADPAVATVRAHFADGAVDEMAPVDGFAVLAHRMPGPALPAALEAPPTADQAQALAKARQMAGTAEALDAAGAVVATADLGSASGPASVGCAIAGEPGAPPEGVAGGEPGAPSVEVAPATTVAPPTSAG